MEENFLKDRVGGSEGLSVKKLVRLTMTSSEKWSSHCSREGGGGFGGSGLWPKLIWCWSFESERICEKVFAECGGARGERRKNLLRLSSMRVSRFMSHWSGVRSWVSLRSFLSDIINPLEGFVRKAWPRRGQPCVNFLN